MEVPEEDNKQVYIASVKNEQETNIKNVYEKCEEILTNQLESFQNKAESLIDLWKQLSYCGDSADIQYVIHLMDWAKLHTLNIVLSGEWKKHKEVFETKLLHEVENCEKELFKLNNSFSLHCKKLIKVINDPWGNSTLNRLLNAQDPVIGTEEFEFFMGESGYLVSMRLKKLCESHCEDLALNLVTAYMRCCDWAEAQNLSMNLTDDQKRFMLDAYIALLFKYKKISVILTRLKSLSLRDGLELVQRFAKKRVNISKLWRHSNRITHYAAVLFCSTAVMQPVEQCGETLTALVDVWLTLTEKNDNLNYLISSIRKVVQVTISAPHMYIFCKALNEKFGPKIKTFNIELYVQALTIDLNLLERQKNEENKDQLRETLKRLSDGLLQLADVLEDQSVVSRECVLTSFSLQPTKSCLKRIEDIARNCGHEVLDTGQWKCKSHPPISSADDLGLQCLDCGEFMGQLELQAALTNTDLSEALTADKLGVSPELCDDLAVLVCSPRYQLLSWLQKWSDLHRLCAMYLNDPERTKNLVTELKFLDIDYSVFMVKREREEEENIYEDGYERLLDMEEDLEASELPKPKKKRGRKKKVKDSEDSDLLTFGAQKSDPEVLKTLRNFRRTLKRKGDSDSGSPSKVFIGDNIHSSFNAAQSHRSIFDYQSIFDNYNTPYVNSYNPNRTFSEIAFRAHEDMVQRQGVYPSDMYYNRQAKYKYDHQAPSTSSDGIYKDYFTLFGQQKTSNVSDDSDSDLDLPEDLSLRNKSARKDEEATTKTTSEDFVSEQAQICEQGVLMNEVPSEITIQDKLETLDDELTKEIVDENFHSYAIPAVKFPDSNTDHKAETTSKDLNTSSLNEGTESNGNEILKIDAQAKKSDVQANMTFLTKKQASSSIGELIKGNAPLPSGFEKKIVPIKATAAPSYVDPQMQENSAVSIKSFVSSMTDPLKKTVISSGTLLKGSSPVKTSAVVKKSLADSSNDSLTKVPVPLKNAALVSNKTSGSSSSMKTGMSAHSPIKGSSPAKTKQLFDSADSLLSVKTSDLERKSLIPTKVNFDVPTNSLAKESSPISKVSFSDASTDPLVIDPISIRKAAFGTKPLGPSKNTSGVPRVRAKTSDPAKKPSAPPVKLATHTQCTCKRAHASANQPIKENSTVAPAFVKEPGASSLDSLIKTDLRVIENSAAVKKCSNSSTDPLMLHCVPVIVGAFGVKPPIDKSTSDTPAADSTLNDCLKQPYVPNKATATLKQTTVKGSCPVRTSKEKLFKSSTTCEAPIHPPVKADSLIKSVPVVEKSVSVKATSIVDPLVKSDFFSNTVARCSTTSKCEAENDGSSSSTFKREAENAIDYSMKISQTSIGTPSCTSIANVGSSPLKPVTKTYTKVKPTLEDVSRSLSLKAKQQLIDSQKSKIPKVEPGNSSAKISPPSRDASVNPEKNLFREKLIETIFTEENGKTVKEQIKETLTKQNDGICNKENTRFIVNKKGDPKNCDKVSPKLSRKSDVTGIETKTCDKILPKLPKKSDVNIDAITSDKISPKAPVNSVVVDTDTADKILSGLPKTPDSVNSDGRSCDRSAPSDAPQKSVGIFTKSRDYNYQEVFQESLKRHGCRFVCPGSGRRIVKRVNDNNFPSVLGLGGWCNEFIRIDLKSDPSEPAKVTSNSDAKRKVSSHRKKNKIDLKKKLCHFRDLSRKDRLVDFEENFNSNEESVDNEEKFNLKEVSVVLHRLNVKFPTKKSDVNKNKNVSVADKTPKKVQLPFQSKHKIEKGDDDNKPVNNNNNKVQSQNSSKSTLPVSKNLKVIINSDDIIKPNLLDDYVKSEIDKVKEENMKLNPHVVLERLELDRTSYVNSVLANVPGLNDTELIRPSMVDSVVQVVQLAGGRPNSAVSSNTQTSTQVTPHIQRIGQPRTDKPETTVDSSSSTLKTTTTTNSKPATSQPSTLINILSQQLVIPGQSNSVRPRPSPLINILSQQIIRPAITTTTTVKTTTTTTTTEAQSNSTPPKVVAGEQQIINQIMGPVRTSVPSLKLAAPSESSSRIVQFICQSTDGKLIPVTSFTPNRVVKVATTQTVTSSSPGSPNYDESFPAKLVQTTPKAKTDVTENSETLPKFQQAFGKSVYQNNVDCANSTNTTNNVVNNTEVDKVKTQPKSSASVNIKPIHGGVIYTRQMPVGQTINLIPQTRAQVFRIATSNSEQISLVKDTVIHNKMSALLAAALQGKKNSEETETNSDSNSGSATRVTLARPTLVQNTRIVKPVLQIPSNVIRNSPQANLSSTTLEQLREFDMVYKQVKERSSTVPANEVTISPENSETAQRISVTYLNQGQKINCAPVVVVSSYSSLQPAASPALSVASQSSSSPCVTPAPTPTHVVPKVAPKSSKGKSVKSSTTVHTSSSKASPIPKPQQKPQEDEHTTQRIFDILAEYAEQLRNSPDLNNKPAPRRRSNPPTNPSQNSKRKKSSSSKKTGQCSSSLSTEADVDDPRTMGSEDSSCGVMQLSLQEDEQPSAVASTSESNDSSITPRQQLILTDSSHNQTHNLIIADSSVGEALKMPNTAVLVPGNYIMPVSMVKGGQQIAVVSGGSKILATVPARSGPNMLLFQSFLNQTRKTTVPTVKYSTIQPITGISSQSLAGVSAQPPVILPPSTHGISTVTLGQSIAVKKLDDSDRVNTELLLTISQSRENDSASEDTPQPDSTNIVSANIETVEIEETATLSDTSSEKTYRYRKPLIATPIATPVIAQATCIKEEITIDHSQRTQTIMTLNINTIDRIKGDSRKAEERVQSVLVTAGTSNGPMLSHSPPQYKQSECSGTSNQNKDDFVRNTVKRNHSEAKSMDSQQGKIKKVQTGALRMDKELHLLCLQRKQAALERELRLQKSLSEECEDLGVDEPSTSDLFPEADLLFDSNHSPSFDQTSQDVIKKPMHDIKEEPKLTLFDNDDFLFGSGGYHAAETELEYDDRSRLLTNGQSGTSTETESPCEDNTLLQTCTSMEDVTLNSPISDVYNTNTPPPVHKFVHKYSNRKKHEQRVIQVENWTAEVSSSEDTTGSTELAKSFSRSPELSLNKRSDEELSDGSFKVVHVAISKTECGADLHCREDADSPSGRGARRSVKKMCSCCNGSQDGAASRKRPASQPHTPTPHKKAFTNKKR